MHKGIKPQAQPRSLRSIVEGQNAPEGFPAPREPEAPAGSSTQPAPLSPSDTRPKREAPFTVK